MSAAALAPRCPSRDELVRRYEALRLPAGAGRGDDGLGRALMMHQGVAAWIEGWANGQAPWAPPLEGVAPGRAGAGGPPSAPDVVPVGLRGQVAQVLTGMAVAGLRGRSSGA